MEDLFHKLRDLQDHSVNNLVEWMKESKVVSTECNEDKVRSLFAEARRVDLASFKSELQRIAAEEELSVDDFTTKISKEVPKYIQAAGTALVAGASAAADTFKNATK